jgi:hypothetical protein
VTHIHWVARQNKLETPEEKDEINKREVHECDGRASDPDAMVAPTTPKPTHKAEALDRVSPTMVSSCEHKEKVRSLPGKSPVLHDNPNIDGVPTTPKSRTHPSHECDGRVCDPDMFIFLIIMNQ